MITPGKWYLWVYICGASVDLQVENAKKDTGIIKMLSGESYFYQETIENKSIEARQDRFKSITFKTSNEFYNEGAQIYIYSSVINEPEFMNFELEEDPKNMTVSYDYNKYEYSSEVTVKFSPLKFQQTLATDKIRYQVTLFEVSQDRYPDKFNCDMRYVYWIEDLFKIELSADHKKSISATMRAPSDSKYFIEIKAFIIHQSQIIKFITYPIGSVDVKSKFWWYCFLVVVGIVGGIAAIKMCKTCYQEMKGWWDSRRVDGGEGVEMRPKEEQQQKKRNDYEAFEDERDGTHENENENGKSPNDA